MVLTRAQEQRLSRLEEMCAERSKMIKQLADMVEAFSRSIAGKSEFPRFEDDCDDDQPPNGEFGESIEHRMVNLVPKAQEENPKLENHEGWEQIEILEVEGDVERDQKMISDAKTFCAHKVFDKMSQHQESLGIKKKKKGLKSWMFKYKKGNRERDLLLLNGKDSLALRAMGTGLETVERDSSNQEKSKLGTEDKGELKGCLERLQASVLLKEESESMVVNEVKAEFKTFDKKSSNKTLSLEDEQDDEHEQNQELLDTSQKMQTRLVYHEEKNGLRVVEAGINKSFMTLEAKVETYFWAHYNYERPIRHNTLVVTKLHKMILLMRNAEMTIPLVRENQAWIENAGFKIQVFSDFDIASWVGLETYGCETKKHALLIVKLANRVWERGKLLAIQLIWELFGLRALIGLEIYSWKYKKQITIGHIILNGMCNKLVYDEEKKKLRHVGDDVKKGKNSFLGDVKVILAWAVKEYMMGKADEMLLPGHHGLLHTFDQCGSLNATVIAGTIMQSSLKSFHQLRVACLHHTSLGFLYGSLPRPPEENHSNFSNMLQYHETWSCISLRTNRVWDPGGSNSEID